MQTVTATEFSRNFSQMLDQIEHDGAPISIVRNHKQIATVMPQRRVQGAMDAFGDLYRPLEGEVLDDWMDDIARVSQALQGDINSAARDPWL